MIVQDGEENDVVAFNVDDDQEIEMNLVSSIDEDENNDNEIGANENELDDIDVMGETISDEINNENSTDEGASENFIDDQQYLHNEEEIEVQLNASGRPRRKCTDTGIPRLEMTMDNSKRYEESTKRNPLDRSGKSFMNVAANFYLRK